MTNLDDTDIKLLELLQENSKFTTKELAAKVNLSATPVFERIRRLEANGYIRKYTAILEPEKIQNGFSVYCNIRLKKHSKEYILNFTAAIKNIKEITECYNVSGDYDFMLKIYVQNMEHYQLFVQEKLGVIESIGSLHSIFVLKEVKHTFSLPIY